MKKTTIQALKLLPSDVATDILSLNDSPLNIFTLKNRKVH